MPDTAALQSACTLCGAELNVGSKDGVCSHCVDALGSVVVVPASTVVGRPTPLPTPARMGIFGDYEIISELARGGMGVVYAARQITLNRRVALKMILTPFAQPEQIRRFQAEAEHAATLEHPNIVPIYDSGSIDGVPYFTMKLISGRALNAELRRLVLDPRKGVKIMIAVARAVHFAHQRGILHRDLKPANVLIDAQGVPYVGDFGIAKRVGTDDGLTREGAVMGTPYYMPPEQASGKSTTLTVAADVYGLGAIFYEILTLRAPFQDADPGDVLRKVKTEDPVPPRNLRAGVDRDLETICLKCLEKLPARRYPSAEELARDLERWMQGEPISARRHSAFERAVKWSRRRPAVACSAALAVVLAAAVAGFYWHGSELMRRAENARKEERRLAAAEAVSDGTRALQTAREALANKRTAMSETALIEAEDRFRVALVNEPENVPATTGLRESALLNFDASLLEKNYRQAREKLLLARSAKLGPDEFERKSAQLAKQESERGDLIRARVKALMDDATSLTRSVTHENGVYELISMKDPITVELLAKYVGHERAECRMLACAALAWIGDASVVPILVHYIQPKTPMGQENPMGVQEAALNAICMLAADDDEAAYTAVLHRIGAESDETGSLLFHNVQLHFIEFARRQAQNADAKSDETPAGLEALAERLYDSHAYREALSVYDRLVPLVPQIAAIRNRRGLTRLELHDPSGALDDFNFFVARNPNKKDGYVNRSLARHDLNDAAGSLSDINKAMELDPKDTSLLTARGLARVETGDVNGGMADYDRALELKKDDIFALCNRGNARAQMKDFAGALADYDRALAFSPMFRQALTGRACARMELHDDDGAIMDFDKTLALDPTQWNCYYNRAVLKMGKKDSKYLDDAIRDFDHLIELRPDLGVAYYNRGVAEDRKGDEATAEKDYRKAIELDAARADAMVNLGRIFEKRGDEARAMQMYERAVKADPQKYEAWSNRANTHFRMGHYDQAKKDLLVAKGLLTDNSPSAWRGEVEWRLKELDGLLKK